MSNRASFGYKPRSNMDFAMQGSDYFFETFRGLCDVKNVFI